MRALHLSLAPLVVIVAMSFAARMHAADGRFDQTLPATTPFKVDIANEAGDISVRSGNSTRIEIHAKIHSIDAEDDQVEARIRAIELNPPVVNDSRGHRVRIGSFADPDAVRNIWISYEIVVPGETQLRSETGVGDQSIEGIQGPVEVTSGSGKLRVWHIGRDVHARTGSGDIDLHDIRGNVSAKAGSGAVDATDIASGQAASPPGSVQMVDPKTRLPITVQMTLGAVGLQIVTGSGDVDVENLEGGLNVTSGSGNIRASGKPSSDWDLDTGTGTVRVQFPVDANLALIAHTSSGTIDSSDILKAQGNKNPHELHGQIGKGGPTVDLKSASGNIEIR